MIRLFHIIIFLTLTSFVVGEETIAPGLEDGLIRVTGLRNTPPGDVQDWIGTQIEYVEKSGVSMARADDAAYFLENALRQRGYKNATVDWKLIEGKQILLTVNEGTPAMIAAIRITGNDAISGEAVAELLTTQTRKRLKAGLDERLPYVSDDIRKGLDRIQEFYQLLGYLDVKITHSIKTVDSSIVNIDVEIHEGIAYQVGSISLPEPPTPKIGAKYDKIQKDFSGKSFSAAIPANLSSRLTALARDAGFYDVAVYVETTDPSPNSIDSGVVPVDLIVTADWGNPVPVSKILVTGNQKVNDRFFERHFEDLKGKPYSPNSTNGEVEELLRTGAFESVRSDTQRQEDGSIALNIEVEEAPSRQLGVYGGFATYEGPLVGFEFRNLNLMGSVRKIDAEVEFSRRGLRGEVEYDDPWFAWSEYRLRASIFAMNRMDEGYSKFETGGRYQFSRKTGAEKRNEFSFFGQASYTDVYESEVAQSALGPTNYFANTTGISYTFDRRDNPRKPRSGFIAQTSISVASSAIASEVEFLRATGRLGFYLPFGASTLRLSARAGTISPMGDTLSIPIDLRFYNGGAQSVRSFQQRELGPRDVSGNPVGGQFYSIFNFEFEIPIPQVAGLSVVPFADAGNLLPDADTAGLIDMRYALGLGLRYETPIGPLRAEYGYNPDQRPGDQQGAVHIGFGVAY